MASAPIPTRIPEFENEQTPHCEGRNFIHSNGYSAIPN